MDHVSVGIETVISYPVFKTQKTQVLLRIIKTAGQHLVGLHRFYTPDENDQPKESKGVYFPLEAWENFNYFLPRLDEKVQALLKEAPRKEEFANIKTKKVFRSELLASNPQLIDQDQPSVCQPTTSISTKEIPAKTKDASTSTSTSPQKVSESYNPSTSINEPFIQSIYLDPQQCPNPTKRLNSDPSTFLQPKRPRIGPAAFKPREYLRVPNPNGGEDIFLDIGNI